MLLTINQEQYPDYLQKFKDAVRSLFPILCFTPDETEAFIREFAPQYDGKSCVVVVAVNERRFSSDCANSKKG